MKICRIFDDFEGEERYEIRQVHSEQLSVVAAFLILHKEEKLKPFSIQNRENETLNSVVTQSKYQRFVNEHFREMTNVVKVGKTEIPMLFNFVVNKGMSLDYFAVFFNLSIRFNLLQHFDH